MSVSLEPRGWSLLLAAIALGAAWWFVRLSDLWYLVAVLAALVVLSVVIAAAFPLLAGVRAAVSASDTSPTVGDTVGITVSLTHRLPLALRLGIVIRVAGEWRSTTVSARREAHARMEWDAARRGPATVRLHEVVIRDPLALARGRVRPRAGIDLLVLPRLLEPIPLPVRSPRGDLSAGTRTRRAVAGHPEGGVRQYQIGDALRQVHWKQSARQGELLVNLPEAERESLRTLLLVTWEEAYVAEEEFELAVSAAATIGAAWLRSGSAAYLLGHGVAVTDTSQLLRLLALVEPAPARDLELDGRFGSATVVTGNVTPRLAGMLATLGSGTVVTTGGAQTQLPLDWHSVPLRRAQSADSPPETPLIRHA
nr:DUF58 domain-containing protein [Actinomycetales bacterium]